MIRSLVFLFLGLVILLGSEAATWHQYGYDEWRWYVTSAGFYLAIYCLAYAIRKQEVN